MRSKLLVLATLAAVAAATRPGLAQEILLEGPLAGAPAVRRLVLFREGRFFATPTINFTLLDTYRRHILFGAKAEYNIFDWLSAGVHFAGGFGFRTGVADQINDLGEDDIPGQDYDLNFPRKGYIDSQLGQLQWLGAIEGRIVPFRGKFSLFGKLFFAMDVYGFLGVGIAGVKERAATDCSAGVEGARCPTFTDRDGNGIDDDNTTATGYLPMESRVAVGPTFGVGLTVFFNEWIGLNLEYRSTPFTRNESGTDEWGTTEFGEGEVYLDRKIDAEDRYLSWNHMMSIGCTFAFPMEARRTE